MSIEDQLQKLEQMVDKIESGETPLEDAIDQYGSILKTSKKLIDGFEKLSKKLVVLEKDQAAIFESDS